MAYHTARLIVTIVFLILAVSALVTRYWFSAFFWVLLAAAVGYPFIRGGKLDLYYSTPGRTTTTYIENVYTTAPPPGATGASPMTAQAY
jgi:hypothetical protein